MFKQDKREIFSFRKFKNGRTDSAIIGATILALGLGFMTTTQTVSADVVNGAGGSEVALVDSVDKTTSVNTNTFTDDTTSSKVLKVDAVLNKGVAEPTKANENKGEADGTDTVTVTSETTVNYKLEEDKSLLKTETVATGKGTIKTSYDKKGLAADTDGKDYRESTADKSGITVSEETGKQDTLELNGKVYERTRSEVEGADKAKYSKTQFNDIEASVSPEGMHNKLGEINYSKTNGKVYLVEETADGQYGKFVETTGVSSDEDAVSKWKAGLANAKDFTKTNVTLQEGDSILVLDKDTYAVGNATTIKTIKKFKTPTFSLRPDTKNVENLDGFDSPTFTLGTQEKGVSITKLGEDGRFKTGDDVTDTMVSDSSVFNFATSNFIYDDNPFFQLNPKKVDSTLQTPTASEALKNNDNYRYLFSLLDFAEKEANTDESRAKVADVKEKVDAYFKELPAKLKAIGADVVWVNNGRLANSYAFYSPTENIQDIAGLENLLSPSGNIGDIISQLKFSHEDKKEEVNGLTKVVTTVGKKYSFDRYGSISVEKITTKHYEGQITKEQVLENENLEDTSTNKESSNELLKKGTVKVNNDGSVIVTSVETEPVLKFYQGEPENNVEATLENGHFSLSSAEESGYSSNFDDGEIIAGANIYVGDNYISATEITSHNETTYNKREVITPIRAYKVVSDGTSTVTHYYREKKAPLTVNYYLENTTTSLAPSENQADLPVKSDYTTKAKEIPSKTETQDLPEKTVTTVTTYELVATPDNANGKIAESGTTVNYYYRAVPKKTEVAKKAPVVVNYYKEGTTEKLADSMDQGQKDIGSKYTSKAVVIQPKVEKQDFADRVVTTTTTYELVAEPTDKNGTVPVGGKVVNYYYREVVKKDEKMKDFKKVVIWHNETNYDVKHVFDRELEKDFEGFDDNSIFLNQKYGTKTSVERHIYDARIGFSEEGDVHPSEDKIREEEEKYAKMVGYSSREELNKFNKNSNTHLDLVKSTTVFESHFDYHTIQYPLTSGHYNMTLYLADFRTRGLNGDLDVIEGKDSDELNLYESKLPDGVKLELTKVTYNVDGGEEKTLDKSGAVFSRENGTMQEGKTTHFTYHYRVVKDEKITNTENLKGSVVVKYVNTDGVEIKNPVTIKDNVDAGQRLTKTITSGTAELGSKTDTVDGTTKYEANTVKEDRIEKDGKTYALIRVLPKDDKLKNTDQVEGVVKPGTTTIIYEYREVEKGNVVVNYYLENTTTKLADSETQTPSYYGTDYKTTAKTIQPKVEIKDTPEKTITTTTTYELVEKPANAEGKVSAEQTVVNYYYRAVTKEDVVLKQAPVTVNYYKEGTTEKLADSVDKGQKQIGSKYMTDAASIEPKVEKVVENGHVVTRTTTYELVKVPEDKDGVVPTGGKVVNYYYREVVKEVAKPNDVPKVDIPEFNGGVPPLDPPVVDITEYKELIGIPGEPEVYEKPDFKGGVTPLDPPVVEFPEFNGGVPGIPEVHEKPEFKGGVPGVPEIHEKPEFKGGVVPNDAPIHEKPEAKIPDVKPIAPMSEKPKSPEKPAPKEPVFVPIVETPEVETPVVQPKVDTPQTPEIVAKESVLPNTVGGDNLAINVLGALTLASVLGLAATKSKKED